MEIQIQLKYRETAINSATSFFSFQITEIYFGKRPLQLVQFEN